jgi:hypothetical protein
MVRRVKFFIQLGYRFKRSDRVLACFSSYHDATKALAAANVIPEANLLTGAALDLAVTPPNPMQPYSGILDSENGFAVTNYFENGFVVTCNRMHNIGDYTLKIQSAIP